MFLPCSAHPVEQVFNRLIQAVSSHVAPPIHVEVRIRFYAVVGDALVGGKCVSDICAAVAEKLHLLVVLSVSLDEFQPCILKFQVSEYSVIR